MPVRGYIYQVNDGGKTHLNYEQHYSLVSSPGLNKNEKATLTQVFITLCFLTANAM